MAKKQMKKSASESIIMRFVRKHGLTIVRWEYFCDCGRAAVVNDGAYYAGTILHVDKELMRQYCKRRRTAHTAK